MKVESRGFVGNVPAAPLLAVDQRVVSSGKAYVVADRTACTEAQRARFIARHLDRDVELVDMPFELAKPAYPYYQHRRESRVVTSRRIREQLGYVDAHDSAEALAATVDWLVENPPEAGAETERQLGDPFDYAREDALIAAWRACCSECRRR